MDKPKFECPICGCNKYNPIIKSNNIYGPGGRSWIDHCICEGCSVVFKDPEKFTKK